MNEEKQPTSQKPPGGSPKQVPTLGVFVESTPDRKRH